MCDPLTIAGVALSAGSAVANNVAANRQASAQASAMAAERARQAAFNQQRNALTAQATGRYDDFDGQQEEKRGELTESFERDAGRGGDMIAAALPRTSSNITVSEDERQREAADDFAGQQRDAMVRMRSFGDLFGEIGHGVNRDALDIGTINSFAQGSQGVLPFELDAAMQRGGNARMLADLMSGLGGISLNAGLSGANPFGGSQPLNNISGMRAPASAYGQGPNLTGLYRGGR